MLVGCHGHSIGTATDENPQRVIRHDAGGQGMGVIRIVYTGRIGRPMVHDVDVAFLQPRDHGNPQVARSMVIGQMNPHDGKFTLHPRKRHPQWTVNSHEFLCVTQAQKNLVVWSP